MFMTMVSRDSVRNSSKQDFMSSTWETACLVGPGVILMTFSVNSRLVLSSGDEDEDKLTFLDRNDPEDQEIPV